MKTKLLACGICIAVACLLPDAGAQTARQSTGGSGSASPQLQQQLQQASSERASLQAENSRIKQDLDQANKEVAKLRAERVALQLRAQAAVANAARLTTGSESVNVSLERTRTQLQEVIMKYRENAQGLVTLETDRNQLRGQLVKREQEYGQCVERNAGLYELAGELLNRLDNRSVFTKVREREPFTRLARTRLENLIDDYRYRVDELRIKKPQPKS
jgi:chromosome segregation ATPase